MQKLTRFQIAKSDIISLLENYDKEILTYYDISNILNQNREFWRLPRSLTTPKFIELLTKNTKLKGHELNFTRKNYLRFTWGDISIYKLALSLERNTYFTHYTALYWHNLTDQIPKTTYVNYEQAKKRYVSNILLQANIDRAFKNSQRESKNIASIGDYKICLLNGKFTNRSGVIDMVTPEDENIALTDVERTLIDIVVRPTYSGGIHEVLNAYRKAEKRVSVNKLSAMLQKLNYVYPYHQAIGFFLQRAGVYRDSQVQLLKKFDIKYDFYIAYNMVDTEYSKEWRLYYPKGF